MNPTQTPILTDTWVPTTWHDYVQMIEAPECQQAKGYYYKGHMRIEMSAVSSEHADNHVVITVAVSLFAAIKGIPCRGLDTATLRKLGTRESQPDIAYYLGDKTQRITAGIGIINLDQYPAPDLVIEVAKTSLLDDLGAKRSLYEELGVAEYWVVDVQNVEILAYAIANQGSHRIRNSGVLPGLKLEVLEEALRRNQTLDQSQVLAWLMQEFQ